MLLFCGDDFRPRGAVGGDELYSSVRVASSSASVMSVAAGRRHTVLATADGAVLAYGENSTGQLGVLSDAPPALIHASPRVRHALDRKSLAKIPFCAGGPGAEEEEKKGEGEGEYPGEGAAEENAEASRLPEWDLQLVTALASKKIVTVRAGAFSSYAIDTAGTVYAWGGGAHGCLGVGGTGKRALPRPLHFARHVIRELAVGTSHCIAISTGQWLACREPCGVLGDSYAQRARALVGA